MNSCTTASLEKATSRTAAYISFNSILPCMALTEVNDASVFVIRGIKSEPAGLLRRCQTPRFEELHGKSDEKYNNTLR